VGGILLKVKKLKFLRMLKSLYLSFVLTNFRRDLFCNAENVMQEFERAIIVININRY